MGVDIWTDFTYHRFVSKELKLK